MTLASYGADNAAITFLSTVSNSLAIALDVPTSQSYSPEKRDVDFHENYGDRRYSRRSQHLNGSTKASCVQWDAMAS